MYPRKEDFIRILRGLGRAKGTIAGYDSDVFEFFNSGGVLTTEGIRYYISSLKCNPTTVKRKVAALKTYCRFFDINVNFSVIGLPRVPVRERSFITDPIFILGLSRIKANSAKYSATFISWVFCVLFYMGFRVNELLTLTKENVILKEKAIKIIGKGNKERSIPIPDSVFNGFTNAAFLKLLSELHYNTVLFWTKEFFGDAFSPHSFRHGYTTKLLDGGVRPEYVQRILGHSNFSTTLQYYHTDFSVISKDVLKVINKEETC